MKLHTLQTLAIFFVAIFVLTKSEENEVSENQDEATTNTRGRRLGTVTAVSVVPGSGNAAAWSAAYATATDVTVKFTPATQLVNSKKIFIEFPGGFLFDQTGSTACTSTGCGSVGASCSSSTITVNAKGKQILEVSASGNGPSAGTACAIVVTNVKFPAPYVPSAPGRTARFTVTTTDDEDDAPVDYVGIPLIYYARSDCKVGGLSGGALADCDEGSSSDCKKCTGANGFVLNSDLQKAATGAGVSCVNGLTAKRKHRCSVIYAADTYLDVAVNTNGNFGTLTCGAYTAGNAPAYNIMQDPSTNKKSAKSLMVDISRRYDDQVVTLSALPSDTLLDIYCHMDDYILSPALTDVRTDENDRIWGDSLVPGTTVTGVSPGTITLTFKHGLELSSSHTIALTAKWDPDGSPAAIFSANTDCTATSGGSSLTLTATSTKEGVRSGTDNVITTFTLGAASTAGNEIVIECNSALTDNKAVASAGIVQYDLAVQNHPVTLKNRYGWASTNS